MTSIAPLRRLKPAIYVLPYCLLSTAFRVDPLPGALFETLDRLWIQAEQIRQLREVDTFGATRLFISPQNAKREHVECRALARVRHACHNVREPPGLGQLLLDDAIDAGTGAAGEEPLSSRQ